MNGKAEIDALLARGGLARRIRRDDLEDLERARDVLRSAIVGDHVAAVLGDERRGEIARDLRAQAHRARRRH